MFESETTVLQRLEAFLARENVAYRRVDHEVTRTSVESAAARGEALEIGGKALVLKVAGDFRLFVLPANMKLDSAAIKQKFETKRTRFATAEELLELTGLVPGSVPPFGRPILELDFYLDHKVTKNQRIAFNAGSLTTSFIVSMEEYMSVAQPTGIFDFSKT